MALRLWFSELSIRILQAWDFFQKQNNPTDPKTFTVVYDEIKPSLHNIH